MKFTSTPIEGAFVVDLEPHADKRGSFARAFCHRQFASAGINFNIAQCNIARTARAGVVRGLHFQPAPHHEQKLVRCIAGAVFDVIVDMRPASETFGRMSLHRLDASSHRALFVPGGVAHGYQTLADDSTMFYMTDRYYAPDLETGLRFDDPALAVPWPLTPRDVSDRDLCWPLLQRAA